MRIPPVEAMEVRILMSATALDNSTLTNDVANQDVPDVIDPTAIDPAVIDGSAIDGSGDDILNGGSLGDVPVDDLDNAYLPRDVGNDVPEGEQFDENLFPADGNGGDVIYTMALNPAESIQETSDTGTTSDWISYASGTDLIEGGNQDDVPVDDLGNAYPQRDVGNELPEGEQFDKNLFPADGNGGYVICTMGLNPAETIQETSDTETTSDWISYASGTDLIEGGNQDDMLLYPVDPVVCDFLPRDVGNDVPEAGDGNDVLSAETSGGVQNFGDPVPMMFQAGVGQPADFENASSGDAGNSSGLEKLNGGIDDSLLVNGAGNDALKGISSQYNLVGSTGTNLPFGGTGGDLMVSGSNRSEGDLRGLWLLFTDSTQATPYETPVDQLGNTRGGTNIGFFANSTAVSDGSEVDNLTQETWTDWYFATSLQDGLADTAVDEFFTRIDSHL